MRTIIPLLLCAIIGGCAPKELIEPASGDAHGLTAYDPDRPLYQITDAGLFAQVEIPDIDPEATVARSNAELGTWGTRGLVVGLPLLVAGLIAGMAAGNKAIELAGTIAAYLGGVAAGSGLLALAIARYMSWILGGILIALLVAGLAAALYVTRGKSLIAWLRK